MSSPSSSSPSSRKLSSMIIGATIGAGIFGVPYAFAHSHTGIALAMLCIASVITLFTNLLLARVVLHSSSQHKDLIGLYQAHFPLRARHLTSIVTLLSFFTSMLVYSRLGPNFLNLITGDVLPTRGALILYICLIAALLRKKLDGISHAEQYIVGVLIALFVFCIGIALSARPAVQTLLHTISTFISTLLKQSASATRPSLHPLTSLTSLTASTSQSISRSEILLPYGVFLYALNGISSIPLLCIVATQPTGGSTTTVAGTSAPTTSAPTTSTPITSTSTTLRTPSATLTKRISRSIFIGRIVCVSIVGGFGIAISGALGEATTQDALHGMQQLIGPWFLRIGGLIGLLAVTSCNVLIGMHTRKSLYQDYHIPRHRARAIVIILPVLAGIMLHASFIEIISFAGGLLTAATGLRVARLVRRVLGEKKHLRFRYAAIILAIVYLSTMLLTIAKNI